MISDVKENPLDQKYKLLLFYKKWSKIDKNSSFFDIAEDINSEYKNFISGQSKEFSNIKEKFKQDLLAQLSSENNIKNSCYSGIDDFINISWGNPRCFILILKKIIEYAKLRSYLWYGGKLEEIFAIGHTHPSLNPADDDGTVNTDCGFWETDIAIAIQNVSYTFHFVLGKNGTFDGIYTNDGTYSEINLKIGDKFVRRDDLVKGKVNILKFLKIKR